MNENCPGLGKKVSRPRHAFFQQHAVPGRLQGQTNRDPDSV